VHERRLRLRPHLRRHRMRLALGKQAEVLRDLGAFQQNAGTAPPGPENPRENSGATPGFRALGLARTLFRRAAESRGRGPPRKLRHPPACARRRGTAASV
jgi:hypothetical protein